jgi:hypothetical protein
LQLPHRKRIPGQSRVFAMFCAYSYWERKFVPNGEVKACDALKLFSSNAADQQQRRVC